MQKLEPFCCTSKLFRTRRTFVQTSVCHEEHYPDGSWHTGITGFKGCSQRNPVQGILNIIIPSRRGWNRESWHSNRSIRRGVLGESSKYQYGLACHWTTVHRVIRRHGLLIRIKPKPQPSKRFQRRHVDSLWQGDTFQFRISGVGKVYVTGFTDDRSRYRIKSKAYLHKGAKEAINALHRALKKGRIPREIYFDNGKQFVANDFKKELARFHIRPIYGRPYHPRGRGKIERYHEVLYRELISRVHFSSLPHFRRELRKFDRRYNYWRKSQALGWKTPASIYFDSKYFNKRAKTRA